MATFKICSTLYSSYRRQKTAPTVWRYTNNHTVFDERRFYGEAVRKEAEKVATWLFSMDGINVCLKEFSRVRQSKQHTPEKFRRKGSFYVKNI